MTVGIEEPDARWPKVAAASMWAVVAAGVCLAMIPLEPSLLEEGLILHFVQRLLDGEHLYRDMVFFSGPFPFELLAALFRVFGEEVVVGRAAVVVLAGGATGATFAIARRAGAGPLAHAAAACVASAPILLFPFFSIYFYTTLACHLSLLAAYASLRGVRSAAWALFCGGVVACVALTKQNLGLVVALGLLASLAVAAAPGRKMRQAVWMVAGGAAVLVATLATYAIRGDLAAFVHSMVVMPLSLDSSFTSGYVNFWPLGRFDADVAPNQAFYVPHLYNILSGQTGVAPRSIVLLTQLLFGLPIVALLAPLVRRLAGARLPAAVWAHQVVLLALFVNLFPRSDWGHLVFVLPSASVQLLLTVGARSREDRAPLPTFAIRVMAGAVILALAFSSATAGRRLYQLADPAEYGPRVPQLPVSKATKSSGVPRIIRFLRERARPGEEIFVARAEPLIYFATEMRNPTPYSGVLPVLREEQQRTIVAALANVRFVVMSEIDQPLFLYYRDELPAVQAYLERHFRVPEEYARRPSWILVLERGEDRGAALVDFYERRASAWAWTRDARGEEWPTVRPAPRLASIQNRRPLAVVLGVNGGGLDFEVEVPDGAVFEADVGLAETQSANEVERHARGVRLQVLVRSRDDAGRWGEFRTLASRGVGLRRGGGARWSPVEVDLSDYAGRTLTLRLQAVSNRTIEPGSLAWWGSPRLVRKRALQGAKPPDVSPPAARPAVADRP
jgi:hypothetical protein